MVRVTVVVMVLAAACGDHASHPDAGSDANPPCVPGAPCDDGNACTTGETCDATGACTGGTAIACDDGNSCTTDSCDPAAGCRFVDISRCGQPNCALAACAGVDSDHDGFPDAVEDAGYIDLNCNGIDDPSDFHFPHLAPYEFSDVEHTGTGSYVMPTVTDPTQPIASSTVVVTIASGGLLDQATFSYAVDGGTPSAPQLVRTRVDIAGNLRLMFFEVNGSVPLMVAGDVYTFTTAMGADDVIADKNVPNLYVEYDYMGFDAPGATCVVDSDCDVNGALPNLVCHAGHCTHDHAPIDPLFRLVVDAFARHGVRLYIDPVHHEVPHARVITWNTPHDGTAGATAACAGSDVVAGDITTGGAVSFVDLKHRTTFGGPFDPRRLGVFHYMVSGHYNTCTNGSPGPGYCGNCPADRATPGGQPQFGATGTSEIPGNDFILSAGDLLDNNGSSTPDSPYIEAPLFMHELGHNLGLHHDGDTGTPELAPNYLSVMNYQFALSGIPRAAAPGSNTELGLPLVDYSTETLNTLQEGALSEADGLSSIGSGLTGVSSFYDVASSYTLAPEAGPIDWNGNGVIDPQPVTVDLNLVGGNNELMPGYRDWDHGACVTSADCRINQIRVVLHSQGVDIDVHEPCLDSICRDLIYEFQCMPWGMADGPPPPAVIAREPAALPASVCRADVAVSD